MSGSQGNKFQCDGVRGGRERNQCAQMNDGLADGMEDRIVWGVAKDGQRACGHPERWIRRSADMHYIGVEGGTGKSRVIGAFSEGCLPS